MKPTIPFNITLIDGTPDKPGGVFVDGDPFPYAIVDPEIIDDPDAERHLPGIRVTIYADTIDIHRADGSGQHAQSSTKMLAHYAKTFAQKVIAERIAKHTEGATDA